MEILAPVVSLASAVVMCPLNIAKAIARKAGQLAGDGMQKVLAVDASKRAPLMEQLDGKFLSCAACAVGTPCGQTAAANPGMAAGKRPAGCRAESLPKTVFVNGINNSPADNCKTAKALATIQCREVVSFYNASDGLTADLSECITNIKRERNVPAQNLADYISENMDGGVDIVAHSQGGLISRQALTKIQLRLVTNDGMSPEQAAQAMEKINATSCGTARSGWPAGPKYVQYTNAWDPVPKAISVGDAIYGYDEMTNMAPAADIVANNWFAVPVKDGKVTKEAFQGLPGHGMDGIYLNKMQQDAASAPKVCRCK